LPLGYRAKTILKTAIVASGSSLSLAIAGFCLENCPPAQSSFASRRSVRELIDVRILDAGRWGLKSYLYQIGLNEGRLLELENKSISSEEFEIPPWRALRGGHSDTGSSQRFPGITGPCHNFPGIAARDGQYVVFSSGASGNHANGPRRFPIVLECSSDYSEIFHASLPFRNFLPSVAWSPDSKVVALLACSERFGFGSLDLPSAFAWHPIPYKSFGFLILSNSASPWVGCGLLVVTHGARPQLSGKSRTTSLKFHPSFSSEMLP
jgi:hypothetical protein